jgi:hypothetical protein
MMDTTYTIRKRAPANVAVNKIVGFNLLETGPASTTKATDVIAMALRNIIQTPVGTCFGFPKFGHRLHDSIFEPLSSLGTDTLETIRSYLQQAIDANYPLPVEVFIDPSKSYVDQPSGKIVAAVTFTFDSQQGIQSGAFSITL